MSLAVCRALVVAGASLLCLAVSINLYHLASTARTTPLLATNERRTVVAAALTGSIINVLGCLSVVFVAVKPRSTLPKICMLVGLFANALVVLHFLVRRDTVAKTVCASNCGHIIANVSSISGLNGVRSHTGAYCLFTKPVGVTSGTCYVHEPSYVVVYRYAGFWCYPVTLLLVVLMACYQIISSGYKPQVGSASQGVRTAYAPA